MTFKEYLPDCLRIFRMSVEKFVEFNYESVCNNEVVMIWVRNIVG